MPPRTRPLHWVNNIAHDPITGRSYVRKMIRGRVVQRAFPTKRSAVMFLEHIVLESAGVRFDDPSPTLTEVRDSYTARLKLLNRSASTVRYYKQRIGVLIDVIGDEQLDRIGQRDVEHFIRTRTTDGVSASTINKEVSVLRALYKHADVERRWHVDNLSAHPKRKTVQPPEVVRAVWDRLTQPVRVAVGLCLFAGLRASESAVADASWVHGHELRVPVVKTGEWNRTWLVKTLRDLLPDSGPLVQCAPITVRRQLVAASKKCGVDPPYWGAGVFRHHCASYAADAGYTEDQIKLILAHSSGTVTARYIHSQSIKLKREILEAVEQTVFTNSNQTSK